MLVPSHKSGFCDPCASWTSDYQAESSSCFRWRRGEKKLPYLDVFIQIKSRRDAFLPQEQCKNLPRGELSGLTFGLTLVSLSPIIMEAIRYGVIR